MSQIRIQKDDIADGGMKSYKQDDDSIILITRDDSTYRAFDGKCPHAGANLGDGLRCGHRIVCPWHHATFDSRDGTLLEPVATEGLTQYALQDEGDTWSVDTDAACNQADDATQLDDTHTLIIGGGGAGFMTAHQLRQTGYGGRITIVSKDKDAPYNRPLLSKAFLAGKMDEDKLALGGKNWAADNDIDLRLDTTVTRIEPTERTVYIGDEALSADYLVVATGAQPTVPNIEGADLDGVHTLRSMIDAKAIKADSKDKHIVIIGTGFIGMEVASALAQAGDCASITVVGMKPRVMSNIVSEAVSDALIKLHSENGVQFVLGDSVDAIAASDDDNKRAGSVRLGSGKTLTADTVILGTGVAPCTDVLAAVNDADGVQVDSRLELRDGTYALGDIAKAQNQLGRQRVEHWRVALQHGQVVAASILNNERIPTLDERIPFFWTMQYGKSLRYSGHAATPDNNLLVGNPQALDYIEYYFDDDGEDTRASAASTLGRDKALVAFSELLRQGHAPTRAQLQADFDIIDQAHALSR